MAKVRAHTHRGGLTGCLCLSFITSLLQTINTSPALSHIDTYCMIFCCCCFSPLNAITLRGAQIYQCNPWNIFFFTYSPRIYLITTGLTLINYYTGISCNWFSWDNQQLGIELSKFSCWLALQISPPFILCVCVVNDFCCEAFEKLVLPV